MRKSSGLLCMFFAFMFCFGFVSCDVDGGDAENTSSKVSLESLSFRSSSESISVGESKTIYVNYSPSNADDVDISYSLSNDGIVSLSGSSGKGCVVTGVSAGSVILIAQCQGYTAYCEVDVSDDGVAVDPYIVVPYVSLEVSRGSRKAVIASLYGGSASDNNNFKWVSSDSCVSIEYSGNTCVIEGKKEGASRITVSNPKSAYSASFMVYVPTVDRSVFYLTTSSNVVKAYKEKTVSFDVSCVGGSSSDLLYLSYDVVEGRDNVTVTCSNGIFSVTGRNVGQSLVEITHPSMNGKLYVRVVVSEEKEWSYVEVDREVIVMAPSEEADVYASVIGESGSDVVQRFDCSLSDSSVISVSQQGHYFHIKANALGRSMITLSNDYADIDKEILVIVEASDVVSTVSYITLSETIIKTEKGSSDIYVKAGLVGGGEEDRNNFVYEVSDSSIIKLVPEYGNVEYSRAIVAASGCELGFYVSPVGIGVATVEVKHPKSNSSSLCTVRVYPEGTISLKAEVSGPSLIKVVKDEPYDGSLSVSNFIDESSFVWSVSDPSVCSLSANGSKFSLSALSDGVVTVRMESPLVSSSYKAVVVCGSSDYVNAASYFYSQKYDYELEKDKFVYVPVMTENHDDDSFTGTFSVSVVDSSVVYAKMSGSVLVLLGRNVGETDVYLSSSLVPGYKCVYHVSVSDSSVSILYPYLLKGNSFLGVVSGSTANYSVLLEGASEKEFSSIKYELIEGNEVFSVTGNADVCAVRANGVGQGILEISHPKCSYKKSVRLYSALTEEELSSKVFMVTDKCNYLCPAGSSILLSVELSDESRASDVVWSCDDVSLVCLDDDFNRCYVSCLSSGSCVVTASLDGASPVKFYVSIYEENNGNASGDIDYESINLPSVVELLTGSSRVLDAGDGFGGEWENLCDFLDIRPSSSKCYVSALRAGFGYIDYRSPDGSYYKRIAVHVCDSPEDFEVSYVMNVPSNVYALVEGSSFNVEVSYGTYSLPENFESDYLWDSSSSCVALSPNGKSCLVKAVSEGKSVITVTNPHVLNSVSFEVLVASGDSGLFVFVCDKVRKMVVGDTVTFPFKIYSVEGGNEVSKYDGVHVSSVSDPAVVTLNVSGNVMRVKGEDTGSCSVTLRSELYSCSCSVMFVVCRDQEEMDSNWVFVPEKTNYLLEKGGEVVVSLVTESNDEEKLSGIGFRVLGSDIISVERIDDKNYKVKGLSDGTDVIEFYDGNSTVEVYVSVTSYAKGSKDIKVEPVISVVKGNEYVSYFTGGVSGFEYDSEKLSIEHEYGKNFFTVKSLVSGMNEITVRGSNCYKVIRVYSYEDSSSLSSGKGWNISSRYNYVSVETVCSLKPVFTFSQADLSLVNYELLSENDCVGYRAEGGILEVCGKREGIARFRVSYPELEPFEVFVQVNARADEEIIYDDVESVYLSSESCDVFVSLDDKEGSIVRASCVGGEIKSDGWVWALSDDSFLTLNVNENVCNMVSKGKEGVCYVTLSSPYASNVITFRVYCGLHYEDSGKKTRYITSSSNTVPLVYGGESVTVTCSLVNMEGSDVSDIVVGDPGIYASVEKHVSSGLLYLTFSPRLCGSARVSLHHKDAEFDSYIDYFVDDDADSAVPYLTTSDNFAFVRPGEYKGVQVSFRNSEGFDVSEISWSYDTDNFVVIGEGLSVQIFGVREGEGDIYVSHPKAMNSLHIVVKVKEGSVSSKYITTSSNVIETQVSSVMDSFSVSLVGDETASSKFRYVSSDSSVLSVVGNNDTCYFRGLKAGTAQVTVSNTSDSSIPDIYVTIIVSEASSGGSYLTCDSSVMYLYPFGSTKTIKVTANNVSSVNESKFYWSVYSQAPSSSDGSEVIGLVSEGSRAVIQPKGEGVAKIRVAYPPLDLKMSVIVYVSAVGKVSFSSSEVELDPGEMIFEEVGVPSFASDMEGFITYKVEDSSVCRVSGTSKVCCISGIKAGTTIVHVYNSYDDSSDELVVKVRDSSADDSPRIYVSKTCFILNPRSTTEKITALILGSGIVEDDMEDIEWSVSGNKSVSIYPKKGPEVNLSLVAVKGSDGVTDIQKGSATITLTHKKCDESYRKTLFVSVEESDDFFTIDESSLNIDYGMSETVVADLVGASQNDYDEVVWSIEGTVKNSDGTTKEIARAMNHEGKRCTVLGIGEGSCYLNAFYKGNLRQCYVTVKGDKYFSVVNNSLYLFPGQEYSLQYELRPSTYVPVFFSSDSSADTQVISYTVDTASQKINIKALNTGSCSLTGMVAGIGTVIVNISVVYNPVLKDRSKTGGRLFIPMYDKGTSNYNSKGQNSVSVKFFCYPPMYFVGAEVESRSGYYDKAVQVSIEQNHDKIEENESAGIGTLTITALKEVPMDDITIILRQYEDKYLKNPTDNELSYDLNAYYVKSDGKTHDNGYKLYFVQNLGDFTYSYSSGYTDTYNGKRRLLLIDSSNSSTQGIRNGLSVPSRFVNNDMIWGEGENHFIVFQPTHEGQIFEDIQIEVTGDAGNKGWGGAKQINMSASLFVADKGLYSSSVSTGNGDVAWDCWYNSATDSIEVPTRTSDDFYSRFGCKPYVRITKGDFSALVSCFYLGVTANGDYGTKSNGKDDIVIFYDSVSNFLYCWDGDDYDVHVEGQSGYYRDDSRTRESWTDIYWADYSNRSVFFLNRLKDDHIWVKKIDSPIVIGEVNNNGKIDSTTGLQIITGNDKKYFLIDLYKHSGGNWGTSLYIDYWKHPEWLDSKKAKNYPNNNVSKEIASKEGWIVVSFKDMNGNLIKTSVPVKLSLYDCYCQYYRNGDITNPDFSQMH